MDIIEKFSGKRPRGWFGPGLTQTFDTLDYLSEAGVEYIGDWVLDDEPVTLKTTPQADRGAALQFRDPRHRHDGAAAPSRRTSGTAGRSIISTCLYAESAERPKFMAIACHPYLSGVPHRIGHVERTFAEILAHDGVVAWDGGKILDWYLTEGRMRDAA